VTEYVNRLAQNISRNSDLEVPPRVHVVQQELRKHGKVARDEEGRPQQVANAMALPGGHLFVYAGMILESGTESELAGVMAHEISHAAARHSHRMANKGKWFNIAQLGATIGLQVFAPGLFTAASYLGSQLKMLLLQGIFNGMGLIFTMNALGVSRDFELEADQLGMQYAWKSGYDPRGFTNLFDRMSKKEGHASKTAFFATHPAFGDRILHALKENRALEPVTANHRFVTDTAEFRQIKDRLRESLRKSQEKTKSGAKRPSLQTPEPNPAECQTILKSTQPEQG
jgi:predicted Zn-dependent protease